MNLRSLLRAAYALANVLGLAGWSLYVLQLPAYLHAGVEDRCITSGDAIVGGMFMVLIGVPMIALNLAAGIAVLWPSGRLRSDRRLVGAVFLIWAALFVVLLILPRRTWC
jgi:hypothetical protein